MSSAALSGESFLITIPNPGTPFFDMRITLAGTDYILTFDWHDREQRWYLDIADSSGIIITAGIKLMSDVPLYNRETLPQAPKGNFYIVDPTNDPPQLADFGIRSQLFWLPAA